MGVIWRLLRLGFRVGLAVFLLTLGAVFYAEGRMAREATPEALEVADLGIVLGASVDGDGRLAYNSRRRVAAGVALLEAGKIERLIFSGGLGGNHPETPAAMLMRDHALALGAPAEALSVEPHAVSTFENLRFAFPMAAAMGADRLVLVSDPSHLARSWALARFLGRPDVALVSAHGVETVWWPHRVVGLGREALAWWLNIGKAAAWTGLGAFGLDPDQRAEWVR
ncbi:MAG: YdcF family protein [Pseudomonadota bacterium]